jgi:ribosome-binding protein aMBF1 (putative translation factor)
LHSRNTNNGAKLLETSYTVIGKYERDEMKPSIDVAKKLAKLVDTTVGYLLGESKDMNVLKDPAMLSKPTSNYILQMLGRS